MKRIQFSALAIIFITAGCNMNNNKEPEVITTDSSINVTPPVNTSADANTMNVSDSNRMATTDSLAAKKMRKGKVKLAEVTKPSGKMEMNKEGVYANVEVMPAFPGGQKALEQFFEDNINYPETALENNTTGTVLVTFSVDEKGKLYSPKISGEKLGDGIEEEALRVVNKMPAWTPGQIKGKNVKTKFSLPVTFEIY